jgi:hypothetical protein
MAIKICSIPFFRGEINQSSHVIRFCGMLKNPSKYEQRYLVRPNFLFPVPVSSALLPDDPPGRIARELWWMNQFTFVSIITLWFSMLIYHLGDEQ